MDDYILNLIEYLNNKMEDLQYQNRLKVVDVNNKGITIYRVHLGKSLKELPLRDCLAVLGGEDENVFRSKRNTTSIICIKKVSRDTFYVTTK